MRKSKVFLAVHTNWAVRGRQPRITLEIERLIRDSVAAQLHRLCCPLVAFGAAVDHVHVLLLLRSVLPCDEVIRAMKGASSNLLRQRVGSAFEWQHEYAAFSVGKPGLARAAEYVRNQRQHHATGTTIDNYE